MRTKFFVPIILGILLAAGLSTPQTGFAEPAAQSEDTCLTKPGGTSPQGRHWYYRVERATGRHCWYLGAQGTKVRAGESDATPARAPAAKPAATKDAPKTASKPAPDSNPAERVEAAAAPVPSTQAVRDEADATDTSSADNRALPDFAARFPALARPLDAKAQDRFSTANNYAEELATANQQDDMPLVWPVLSPAERVAAASKVRWEYLLGIIAAALALAATLVGAIFNRSSPLPSLHFDLRGYFDRMSFRRAPETVPPRRPLGEVLRAIRHAEEAAARHAGPAGTAFAPKRVATKRGAEQQFADQRFAANRFADPRLDDLARRPTPHVPPQHATPRQAQAPREAARDAGHDVVASLEQLLQGWQRTAA
jgi:hypothetical protein